MRLLAAAICLWPFPALVAAMMLVALLDRRCETPIGLVVFAGLFVGECVSANWIYHTLVRLRPLNRPGNPRVVPAAVALIHALTVCGLIAGVMMDVVHRF